MNIEAVAGEYGASDLLREGRLEASEAGSRPVLRLQGRANPVSTP